MLKRVLIIVILFVVALAGVTQFLLPGVVDRAVSRALTRKFGNDYAVTLKSVPAARMLLGQFDQITVELKNPRLLGMTVESFSATASQISVNLRDILGSRDVKVERSKTLDVTITVSEAALTKFVAQNVPQYKGVRVTLVPGKALVAGTFTFNNRDFRVAVEGFFQISGGTKVEFVLRNVAVDGVPMGEAFVPKLRELLGGPELIMDGAKLPYPVTFTSATIEDGKLIIRGTAK